MALKDLFQFFVPKDKTFFPLFNQASTNLIQLSETLHEAVNVKGDREEFYKKIEDLVANIEDVTHKMNLELSKNFITPFDREDIHALITSINEVASYIYSASNRMKLYQVEKITKSIRKLTEINLEACHQIGNGIVELKDLKNLQNINDAVKKINKLESKADVVYDKAVADLFENENDVKNIIKYKEVLSALHNATVKCKVVARTLEAVSVKHA
jgi:predicted phosphate transport protein (TIGR00153 family)